MTRKKAPPSTMASARGDNSGLGKSPDASELVRELSSMIEAAQKQVATVANATLTLLHWHISHRVSEYVLEGKRAEYGAQIVSTASRELSWSHFLELIYLKDPLARDFYLEMSRIERWSIRGLRERIQSMLFERTELSKKPEELIQKELTELRESGELTPDLVFRDPYMLPFLGLADTYSESDLEAAILREIERFLLENPPGPGQADYFDDLLKRIRDIRSSERRFYQKVLDIYALSADYDPRVEASRLFFKTVQNKLHWTITRQTAAEREVEAVA